MKYSYLPEISASDPQHRMGLGSILIPQAITAWKKGFGSDYWLTFRQADSQGDKVRKGEKTSLVTFWKLYDAKEKQARISRYRSCDIAS